MQCRVLQHVALVVALAGCEAFVAAPARAGWAGPGIRGRSLGIRGAVSQQSGGPKWERPPSRGSRDVVFGARVNTLTPAPPGKADEGCSLSEYLKQPPEAFTTQKLPEGADFQRIGDSTFRIVVPKLQILNVWVKPVTEASIRVQDNAITVSSSVCDLQCSQEIAAMGIPDRFEFGIDVKISAREDPRGLRPTLLCQSNINVWVDVPMVFRALPTKLQEDTASAVMSTTLSLMQGAFMKGMGEDYRRWSTDAALRKARASAQVVRQKGA